MPRWRPRGGRFAGRRSSAPDDDALRFLFVMTYGRSGSTLLTGVLNSTPGFLIRGENWDALHHLFVFHRTMVDGRTRWSPDRVRRRTHPFFGAADYPTQRAIEQLRSLVVDTVLRPRPDTRVAGFKEIRWHHDDLARYVDWLREAFPGARFVVNTRDHADVLRSGWWAREPDGAQQLEAIETRILGLADHLGEDAYRVHYDDYVADPGRLRGLFEWLGEDFDEEAVRAVLEVRHSVGQRRPEQQ